MSRLQDAPIEKVRELRAGDAGTDDTVKEMIRLIRSGMQNPDVKRIARSLKSQSKDQLDYFRLAHEYVVNNIRYEHDKWNGKEAEVVASARLTLAGDRDFGDCDDMVVALATLLKLDGIPVRIKVVAWKPEYKDQFTHVYLLAKIKALDAWIPSDPVRDATLNKSGFGWEIAPVYRRKTYLV